MRPTYRLLVAGVVFPAVVAVGLMGCASTTSVPPADIAALESGLTIAETLAYDYTSLPACPLASNVCADPATKAAMKTYDATAYAAIKAVEASHATADMALAEAALAAYQASITAAQ